MTNYEIDLPKGAFNEVYIPHLDNLARTQIYYGGSASGKSVFLAQRCVLDILNGGRNYLVCRAVNRYVPRSVWTEIQRVIKAWGLESLFLYRIQAQIIECSNGYQILFTGLDDTEKLKSTVPAKGVITDIWVEEATEVDKGDIRTLFKRQRGKSVPKRLTMSFNPILKSHWIYKEYFHNIEWVEDQTEYRTDELSIQKTWYKHNRFLSQADIDDLENETDEYYYNVYTLGNWGVLGHVVFRNWKVKDLSAMEDQFTNRRNGLDFGFSADPAALICTHYDRKKKTIYIFNELYETGLTNDKLAELANDILDEDMVVCDSSEPKSIAELQMYGTRAAGAIKGKDSILHGIQWLQQHTIIIDKTCVNTVNEFSKYCWKSGRDGLAVSPARPLDRDNHLIDALRYAYESDARAGWLL